MGRGRRSSGVGAAAPHRVPQLQRHAAGPARGARCAPRRRRAATPLPGRGPAMIAATPSLAPIRRASAPGGGRGQPGGAAPRPPTPGCSPAARPAIPGRWWRGPCCVLAPHTGGGRPCWGPSQAPCLLVALTCARRRGRGLVGGLSPLPQPRGWACANPPALGGAMPGPDRIEAGPRLGGRWDCLWASAETPVIQGRGCGRRAAGRAPRARRGVPPGARAPLGPGMSSAPPCRRPAPRRPDPGARPSHPGRDSAARITRRTALSAAPRRRALACPPSPPTGRCRPA
jgi:hypothetical protein